MLNLSENPEKADRTAADGRVCGIATIDGRKVAVIADDRTVEGGSDGYIGCWRKHSRLFDLAVEKGYPEIYLSDNLGGLRLPEGMGSAGMSKSTIIVGAGWMMTPRKVPVIGAIMGECFGEASFMAAQADFAVMVKGGAMGVAGPRSIKLSIGEEITPQQLGGWELRSRETGEIDVVAENDEECLAIIREYLSYMPSHNGEEPPFVPTKDDPYRKIEDVGRIVPDDLKRGYDMHRLIKRIVDDGKYFSVQAEFAKALITCLARIGGRVVGIIANNSMYNAGAPDVPACDKACSFICLCDSFNIPLVFLVDVPGMFPGSDSERQRLPTKILNWLAAERLATVPKITIILRKAYGMGFTLMLGPRVGADYIVAWPTASISFVAPEIGVDLVHGSKIAQAQDPEAERERLINEWSVDSAPWAAAEQHLLDDIIDPRDTRKWLAETLDTIAGNRRNCIGEHKLSVWPVGF